MKPALKLIAACLLINCTSPPALAQEPTLDDIIQHLELEHGYVEFTCSEKANKLNFSVDLIKLENGKEIKHDLAGHGVSTANRKPFESKLHKLLIILSPNRISISTFDEKSNKYESSSSGRGWKEIINSSAPNPNAHSTGASHNLSVSNSGLTGTNNQVTLKEFYINDKVVAFIRLTVSEQAAP